MVQRLAVHLYTPSLCTGFIGNSCVLCLVIRLCSSGNLVSGMTPLGSSGKMCAWAFEQLFTLDFLHRIFLCDGFLTGESIIPHNSGAAYVSASARYPAASWNANAPV